jgi:hypothetical protein
VAHKPKQPLTKKPPQLNSTINNPTSLKKRFFQHTGRKESTTTTQDRKHKRTHSKTLGIHVQLPTNASGKHSGGALFKQNE